MYEAEEEDSPMILKQAMLALSELHQTISMKQNYISKTVSQEDD